MNVQPPLEDPLAKPLTARERDVLDGMGRGLTNRQIAEQLSFALSTVKWYVRQIYNKLGVANRQEAITRAHYLGLLTTAAQQKVIRHNLTIAATPIVGREQALDTLDELVRNPQIPLITIVGPGGIGKTQLAVAEARRQLHPHSPFTDGVFFVALAPVETAEGIVAALAAAIGFQFQGSGSETDQLLNYLAQKRMLLILDNFEHLMSGRSFVAEIRRRAAQVMLIITSRERLHLQEEQLFPLTGLEITSSEGSSHPPAAVQLFLTCARRTVPDYQLLEEEAATLQRICQLVEGMPLGLELAASWVGVLPLAEIAAEIAQSLDLLATEHHNVPPRHRTMQAALETSWGRLDTTQQQAFQALTIFRGGFTRPAAVAVANAALPLLVKLVNKSWLTYDRTTDRYHIHELLRQYGAAIRQSNILEDQAVREKHSRYFCTYLHDHESDWFTDAGAVAARNIQREIDNIQTAWRWAAAHNGYPLLARGIESLYRFYERQGLQQEGQRACRLVDEGLPNDTIAAHAQAAERWALKARNLAWQTGFHEDVNQQTALIQRSQALLDQSLKTGRDCRREQALIYQKTGQILVRTDLAAAIVQTHLGLSLCRELQDRSGEIEALRLLGSSHMNQGNLDQAAEIMVRALDICQQLNFTAWTAEFTARYSQVQRYRGHFTESEAGLRHSIQMVRQLENQPREMDYLSTLSYTLAFAGKFADAKATALEAIELDILLNDRPDAWRLGPLTKACFHLGQYSEARAAGLETLAQADRWGHRDNAAWGSMFLGNVALACGDLDDAEQKLIDSMNYLKELNHTYRDIPQAILSYVRRALGNGPSARELLHEPLRSAIQQRSISPLMKILPVAALLAADNGRPERAIELYGAARQFDHIANSRWFADVACRELDGVAAALSSDIAAAALARGQTYNVWETAAQLFDELLTS